MPTSNNAKARRTPAKTSKDLKRLIRARMAKTGESYTAARAVLTERRERAQAADYAATAGMSDAAVAKKTGKDWRGWVDLLDGVVQGEPALEADLAQRALQRLALGQGGRKDPLRLTEREEEVLRWMAGGVTSTRALAVRLGVTERTVKFHIGNVLEKLQVSSRAEAVSVALREGLVKPEES